MRRHRRIAFAGFLWGLVAPLIGLYLGLAVNVTIGILLTLPWLALSVAMDQGMVELPSAFIVAAFLLSGFIWAVIFVVVGAVVAHFFKGGDPSRYWQ